MPSPSTPAVVFYFDFLSPYSYLAHSQLPSLGAPVRLAPIQVLEVMKIVGNVPTTITCAAKGAYARKDLARWATRYGVRLAPSDVRKLDSALLLRVATAADSLDVGPPTVAAIYAAVWGGAGDVGSPEALEAYLTAAGLPGAQLLAAAASDAAAATLKANTEAAAAAGVFGAPTLQVGGDLYFGNDRLDFVREALSAAKAAA